MATSNIKSPAPDLIATTETKASQSFSSGINEYTFSYTTPDGYYLIMANADFNGTTNLVVHTITKIMPNDNRISVGVTNYSSSARSGSVILRLLFKKK